MSGFLRCTTSSCDSGSTKFSLYAYIMPKVSLSWWWRRCTGSSAKYSSVSCIQPMFHFIEKPRPPECVGRDTIAQSVDSSAITTAPGQRPCTTAFSSRMNSIASRFWLPPYLFGTKSPWRRLKSR